MYSIKNLNYKRFLRVVCSSLLSCYLINTFIGIISLVRNQYIPNYVIFYSLLFLVFFSWVLIYILKEAININLYLVPIFGVKVFMIIILGLFFNKYSTYSIVEPNYIGLSLYGYDYEINSEDGQSVNNNSNNLSLYHINDVEVEDEIKKNLIKYKEEFAGISKTTFIFWQTGYIEGYDLKRLKQTSGYAKYNIDFFSSLFILFEWFIKSISQTFFPYFIFYYIVTSSRFTKRKNI